MELIHVYCFFLAQNVRESPGMLAHGIILVKSIIRTYIYIFILYIIIIIMIIMIIIIRRRIYVYMYIYIIIHTYTSIYI